ncbi:MAG TPA: hypothetical protein VN946_17155 [Terriglobales bacterium]|jgi:hypothetical protein|nr:hypothetical protein [Terriglobales bacterium]
MDQESVLHTGDIRNFLRSGELLGNDIAYTKMMNHKTAVFD